MSATPSARGWTVVVARTLEEAGDECRRLGVSPHAASTLLISNGSLRALEVMRLRACDTVHILAGVDRRVLAVVERAIRKASVTVVRAGTTAQEGKR